MKTATSDILLHVFHLHVFQVIYDNVWLIRPFNVPQIRLHLVKGQQILFVEGFRDRVNVCMVLGGEGLLNVGDEGGIDCLQVGHFQVASTGLRYFLEVLLGYFPQFYRFAIGRYDLLVFGLASQPADIGDCFLYLLTPQAIELFIMGLELGIVVERLLFLFGVVVGLENDDTARPIPQRQELS